MEPVATSLPSTVAGTSKAGRHRRSPYRRPPGRPPEHGAALLTRALRTVRLDMIDRRSQVGVALRRIRDSLTAQLGDPSAAETILIEHAAKLAVVATAISEYIFSQESLVREGSADLLPVVAQYGAVVANLTRLLTTLGCGRL